jgi:hypothetical protein
MHRDEVQFCRDQAQRILELAKECTDSKVRDRLAMIANEWLDRAKAKENCPGLVKPNQTGASYVSGKMVKRSQ